MSILEWAERLERAGIPQEQAKVHAIALNEAVEDSRDDLVTRKELPHEVAMILIKGAIIFLGLVTLTPSILANALRLL